MKLTLRFWSADLVFYSLREEDVHQARRISFVTKGENLT